MREDSYIKITGRKKDLIIRGGENISGPEVENILLQMPQIREVAAVSMPDHRLGEKMCVYAVLQKGQSLSLEDIICFFAEKRVAKFKYPERLEIVRDFPRTASGKIQKSVLRKDIRIKLEQEEHGQHS